MQESQDLDRRDFARIMATGAASVLAGAHAAAADAPTEKPAPEKPTLVESYLDLVKQRYADERLTAEALLDVRIEIAQQLARSKVLSAFPLSNADAPAVLLTYRKE